jgi:hypothetical protein
MNEHPHLDATVDIPPSGDDLDAGLARIAHRVFAK